MGKESQKAKAAMIRKTSLESLPETKMNSRHVLFKVLMGLGGHEYVIYDNGDIEGFGDGAIVFNCFPQLLLAALSEQKQIPFRPIRGI